MNLTHCHSRPGGNGLNTPLDSGLRRNDGRVDSGLRQAATGLLPSRRIQDFLSINDGVDSGLFPVIRCQVVQDGGILSMTGRWNNALAVIPAKAGIQGGGGPGVLD